MRRLDIPAGSARARLGVKLAVAVLWILVIIGALLFVRARVRRPTGQDLNRLAWEASFQERGLLVPTGGPRDGYWGQRMPKVVEDPDTGWREAEAHLAGLVESDALGIQRFGSADAGARRLVILGASVAWAAYASSIETTYVHQLATRLGATLGPVHVSVVAAGAWDSENELRAFRTRVLPLEPDLVLLLNGLNDLSSSAARRRRRAGWPEIAPHERAPRYLANMAAIRDLASRKGVTVAFALQPSCSRRNAKPRSKRACSS